ncbi:B12-binding domain-containing radical SAM protein [Sorangium sp. So ce388]|uniref:B12-binding domain-containing radical SAM protein n=1 Tax=Sorangium sp. So ce388 TaxID=3133309 RepID=UPI003F5C02B4
MVADDELWIQAQLPDANQFVPGLAEDVIESTVAGQLVTASRGPLPIVARRSLSLPSLNYELLDRWHDFQPSIEVSRGCGMHCTFCAEAEEPLGSIMPPRRLANEFEHLVRIYGTEDIHPYLEASFFRPTTRWCNDFRDATRETGAILQWRTETRVDAISSQQLETLARSGLQVLDLGLESASPRQLRAMKKTTQPETYLHRASQLLRACEAANVWTKVNILLHPGETMESINETIGWLELHRTAIKGLSVGPTILFRYGQATDSLLREFETLGASEAVPGSLHRLGYAHLNLSADISHDAAMTISRDISRSFMHAKDYFDLKSFSYFPRSFRWNDFQDIVRNHSDVKYSFGLNGPSDEFGAQQGHTPAGTSRRR